MLERPPSLRIDRRLPLFGSMVYVEYKYVRLKGHPGTRGLDPDVAGLFHCILDETQLK